jgi:hypothetical protein
LERQLLVRSPGDEESSFSSCPRFSSWLTLKDSLDLSWSGQAKPSLRGYDDAECRAPTPTFAPGEPPGTQGGTRGVETFACFPAWGRSGAAASSPCSWWEGFLNYRPPAKICRVFNLKICTWSESLRNVITACSHRI